MAKMRTLHEIAFEIQRDWKGMGPNHPAFPYLGAMNFLDTIEDFYGYDSARSIVNYFLANAGGWRGETAKRIKAELRKLVGR